jgi:hypothetical protein
MCCPLHEAQEVKCMNCIVSYKCFNNIFTLSAPPHFGCIAAERQQRASEGQILEEMRLVKDA